MTDRNDDAPQAPDRQTQHCARCGQDVVPVPLDPEFGTKCPDCGALLSGSTSEPAAASSDADEAGRSTAADAHHDEDGDPPQDPSDAGD